METDRPERQQAARRQDEQDVLRGASLMIAGCGALGAQVALSLVARGAEWLTLADAGRRGIRQASPLSDQLFDVNPFASVEVSLIEPAGVDALVSNADLIIDTLDSTTADALQARYLLHNTAKRHGTPVVTSLETGDNGLAIVYDYRDADQPVLDDAVSEPELADVDGHEVLSRMVDLSRDETTITPCAGASDDECAVRLAAVIADKLVYDVLFERPVDRLTMIEAGPAQRSAGASILRAGRKVIAMYALRRRLRDVRRRARPTGFTPLQDDIFKDLRPYMEEREYEAGSVVIRQGDPAEDFFVLVQGRVQVEHEEREEAADLDDFDDEPVTTYTMIADLGPGDFFGEMALLSDSPRNASVVVTERCQVLVLSRGAFNLYLDESQPAFQRLREIALARHFENQETYGF